MTDTPNRPPPSWRAADSQVLHTNARGQMYFPRQPFHASAMLRAMADTLESHPITEPSFSASPGVVLSTEDDIHGVRMSFSCNVMAEMDEFRETVAEAYKRYSGKPAPWSIEANPTSQEH